MRYGEFIPIVGNKLIGREREKEMKNKIIRTILIILGAAVFFTLALVIWSNMMYRRSVKIETAARSAPAEVVQNFYTWYISHPGNPLVDQAYQSSEYLSPEFITYLNDFTQSGEWSYDPILCAQNIPAEVTAFPAQISVDKALVQVTTSFVDHKLAVELTKTDGNWKINKVIFDF